jgi:hypothetical protein
MFKNLDNGSDTEAGLMRSGRPFREVPLVNLFKQNYGDEGFYSGEEAYLTDEEYSKFARTEEVQIGKLRQGEPKTLGTASIVEVSNITPPVVLESLSNQSKQSS